MKIVEFFQRQVLNDRECWILWAPIIFGAGILVYFSLKFEPDIRFIIVGFVLQFIVLLIIRKWAVFFYIGLFLCLFFSGFAISSFRAHLIKSPVLEVEDQFYRVWGNITSIIPQEYGARLVLDKVWLPIDDKSKTPKKIRITVRSSLGDAKIGDRVKLSVVLSKPSIPVIPGGYDFARNAYFNQIGAVGYAVSNVKVVGSARHNFFWNYVENMRVNIQNDVLEVLGKHRGGIATALMIGEYSTINKQVLESMRTAGLAHILSVSGLHLSLVAAICFFAIRFCLNLFENFTLKYNVKKIAAFVAIFGSLFYLLISGMHIAALRAYIMSTLIIISIIIDRTPTPMRSIALAGFIILVISPENIIHPSFQMSFSAVVALIASYELYKKMNIDLSGASWVKKLFLYFFSLGFSSLIAGLATAPFAAYHFNQYSNYSVFANLLAVPLTSFFLMPCVVLAFILYPFNLQFLALYPMSWGLDGLIYIAKYTTSLPHSLKVIPSIPDIALITMIFGGVWLCLWKSSWRLIGVIPIVFSFIIIFTLKRPDIIIDGKSGVFAFLDYNNRLIFSDRKLSRFTKKIWQSSFGQKTFITIGTNLDFFKFFNCNKSYCIYKKNDKKVIFDFQSDKELPDNDLLLSPYKKNDRINTLFVDKEGLEDEGTHAIYLGDKIRINSVRQFRGKRLWSNANSLN